MWRPSWNIVKYRSQVAAILKNKMAAKNWTCQLAFIKFLLEQDLSYLCTQIHNFIQKYTLLLIYWLKSPLLYCLLALQSIADTAGVLTRCQLTHNGNNALIFHVQNIGPNLPVLVILCTLRGAIVVISGCGLHNKHYTCAYVGLTLTARGRQNLTSTLSKIDSRTVRFKYF